MIQRYASVLAVATLLGACRGDTAVLVRLEVDDALAPDVVSLGLEVYSNGRQIFERHEPFDGQPQTLSVRPGALDEDATIYLHAVAETDGGGVAHRWQQFDFVAGEDGDACLIVEAPCLGIDCGTDDCRAGGCEPIAAAEPDCAPTRCTAASSCDDGDDTTTDTCGADQTCTHVNADDRDGDGHLSLQAGGDDCDDLDDATWPGADEPCDGVDRDCDGVVDGTILARTAEESIVVAPRLLVTNDGWLVAWTDLAGNSPVDRIAHLAAGDDTITPADEAPGVVPTLVHTSARDFLVHQGLAGNLELVALEPDGTLVGQVHVLASLAGCSDTNLVARPVAAASSGFVAVAYHDCADDPAVPVGQFVGLDTLDAQATPLARRLSTGATLFPTLTLLHGNALASWSEGDVVQAASIGPDATVSPIELGLPGYLPSLVAIEQTAALVYLNVDRRLRAFTLAADDLIAVPLDPEPSLAVRAVFAGTDSGYGSGAVALVAAREGVEGIRDVRSWVVAGDDAAWTTAHAARLTAADRASAGADVSAGEDGTLYFVDAPGDEDSPNGAVVFGRLSCRP